MYGISGKITQDKNFIYNTNQDYTTFNHGVEEYIIVFNGELYNKEELKNELELVGYEFNGDSDIEIIGYCYITWKEKVLNKLNGVFSFVVWEKKKQKLFCARDKIGVKPLFFTIKDGEFIFASEIKTFFEYYKIPAEVDEQSVAEIILVGPGRTPGYGIFKNIRELEPGMWGIFENGGFKKYKYWDLTDREHTDHSDNFEQTVEKVRYFVVDSITRQLKSDAPVCTLLSGGAVYCLL